MGAEVDPKSVRRIARRLLLEAANGLASTEAGGHIGAAIQAEAGFRIGMLEYSAWFEAVYEALTTGQFTVLWPDEQPLDPARKTCSACGHYFLAHRNDVGCTHCECKAGIAAGRKAEQPQDDGDVRRVALGVEIATTERITSLLYDLDERTKERDEARELACVSLDILKNVSDEPMRELYDVDDFGELPGWFTGYGKPSGALEARDTKAGE